MERPTKRKAFNFLRSYFDVVNELQNDADKLSFLMAVINKQFLDEEPKDLNFVVNLCYQSQKHAVESSVKGWKRVSNTDLIGNPTTNPLTNHLTNPMTNPTSDLLTKPTTNPKEEEEEVKEKEKVKEEKNIERAIALESEFETFWRTYDKVSDYHKCKKKFMALSNIKRHHVMNTVSFYVQRTPEKKYRKNPYTWLNGECWNDELAIMKESDLKEPKSFVNITPSTGLSYEDFMK